MTAVGVPTGTASPRSRRVLATLGVVVVNAVLQGALVAVAPALPLTAWGAAFAAASGAILLAAVTVCWRMASSGSSPGGRVSISRMLGLVAATGLVVIVGAVTLPVVVPFLVAGGCPVIAAGGPGAAGWRLARRHPLVATGLLALTALAVVVVWLGALVGGLFISGAVASALVWLAAGLVGASLIAGWSRLAARP